MNKEKIKELEKQKKEINEEIKKLKEEKPKTTTERLDSIEKTLEEILEKTESNKNNHFQDLIEQMERSPSMQPILPRRTTYFSPRSIDVIPLMPQKDLDKYFYDLTMPNTNLTSNVKFNTEFRYVPQSEADKEYRRWKY